MLNLWFEILNKQGAAKAVTVWFVLEKEEELESFQNLREKYDLGTHELYRYLQFRDDYRKEIIAGPAREVIGVIQIIISAYKDSNIRTTEPRIEH